MTVLRFQNEAVHAMRRGVAAVGVLPAGGRRSGSHRSLSAMFRRATSRVRRGGLLRSGGVYPPVRRHWTVRDPAGRNDLADGPSSRERNIPAAGAFARAATGDRDVWRAGPEQEFVLRRAGGPLGSLVSRPGASAGLGPLRRADPPRDGDQPHQRGSIRQQAGEPRGGVEETERAARPRFDRAAVVQTRQGRGRSDSGQVRRWRDPSARSCGRLRSEPGDDQRHHPRAPLAGVTV